MGIRQLLPRWISLSLNDPQWGRSKTDSPPPVGSPAPSSEPRSPNQPNQPNNQPNSPPKKPTNSADTPPDLDEVVKQFKDKFAALFGNKPKRPNPFGEPSGKPPEGGNGNGSGFNFPKLPIGGIGALLALAAVLWLASGFYIVDEGKRGVVLRFGKYIETTQPGPRWHWPYPIETKEIVDLSNVKSVEIGKKTKGDNRAALMLTEDLNIIEAFVEVQYTLKDAKEFAFNNLFSRGSPSDVIAQVAETAIREVIGKRKMDALLSQGGRADVAQAAQKLMQDVLNRYATGIQVSKVNLQSINPPEQVVEAFNDVNKAEQDRDRLRNEGQAYANDVVPKARGTAARLVEEATGYSQSVVSRAEGDASRFSQLVQEYDKAPKVMRERLYIDMMQSVLGNSSKVLIDQKSGGNNMLYLPLDKLLERSRSGEIAPQVSGSVASATTETTTRPALPEATQSNSDATRDQRTRDLRGTR